VIRHEDCRIGLRVAFRSTPDEIAAGEPAIELGTVDMLDEASLEARANRPVRVCWDNGVETSWPALSSLELATDELEDEYGGSAAAAGAS
jgi:hypothetical protein